MIKILKSILLVTVLIILVSCGGSTSKQPANAKGFETIENEIKSKFGEDAYFTKVAIMYDKSIGNMIALTVTEDPESMKMGEWTLSQNVWKQTSELTLEVPEGTKAADFMFQLNDKISLIKLGELVEKAGRQLTAEKSLENPTLAIANIKFPKNGDITKTEYSINLKPENGGTTFTFRYKLNGEFIEMNY